MQEVIGSNPIFSTITVLLISKAVFCFFATIAATKYGMKAANRKHPYKPAKFYRRKGNLAERWYVEFWAWDGTQLKRRKEFCPAKHQTAEQRETWGNKVIQEVNNLLESGYCFGEIKVKPKPTIEFEPTINQVFDVAILKAASLRKKSQSGYKGILNKFREWLGPDAGRGMEVITRRRVSEYSDYLLSNDLSTTTINNYLNITRLMIGKAKKAEYVDKNPFVYEKLTETDSYSNVAFTRSHQQLMEDYLKEHNYPLYVFTRIMYYNFIRPGELIQLRMKDFDFSSNSVTVVGGVAKNRKTNTVPLHPALLELLKEYQDYPGKFYICGKHLKPGMYKAGDNAAYEAHKEALAAVGLSDYDYTLYSWRHTGAVRAYKAGTDIKTLQFLFRHASVTYTEIYLKSLKLQLKDIKFKNW